MLISAHGFLYIASCTLDFKHIRTPSFSCCLLRQIGVSQLKLVHRADLNGKRR